MSQRRVRDDSHMAHKLDYRRIIDVSHMGHTLLNIGLRWITYESHVGYTLEYNISQLFSKLSNL